MDYIEMHPFFFQLFTFLDFKRTTALNNTLKEHFLRKLLLQCDQKI